MMMSESNSGASNQVASNKATFNRASRITEVHRTKVHQSEADIKNQLMSHFFALIAPSEYPDFFQQLLQLILECLGSSAVDQERQESI